MYATRFRAVLLVPMLLLLSGTALALMPDKKLSQYILRSYQVADGLPQNSALTVAQTPDGYLWLGTEEGLVRFDGARFVVFDKHNTPELPTKYVSALAVDATGRLWVGTDGGLAVMDDGHFQSVVTAGRPLNAVVTVLVTGSRGELWVGAQDGLYRVDGTTARRIRVITNAVSTDAVRALVQDRNGRLWIATSESGLFWMDPGETTPRKVADVNARVGEIGALYEDSDGTILIGTATGRVFGWSEKGIHELSQGKTLDARIKSIKRDRGGNLWIAAAGGGIHRLSKDGYDSLDPAGRPVNDVRIAYEDTEGSLWFGTHGAGLLQLRDSKFTSLGSEEGLAGDVTWSVASGRDGSMWFGTDAGLSHYVDGRFDFVSPGLGLKNERVRSIMVDNEGAVWFGTQKSGAYRLLDGKVTEYSPRTGLRGEAVRGIMQDSQGRVWLGTEKGLEVIQHGKLQPLPPQLEALGPFLSVVFHEDHNGDFWFSSDSAGLRVWRHDGTMQRYTETDGMP